MTYTNPTNRIDLNNRIQHAIYRSRDALTNCPTTDTVDAILAQILGEVLPLVDRAEHMAANETIERAIDAIRRVPGAVYRTGDTIRVIHDDGTYHVTVTERFIEGGEFLWRGYSAETRKTITGSDDMITHVTREV